MSCTSRTDWSMRNSIAGREIYDYMCLNSMSGCILLRVLRCIQCHVNHMTSNTSKTNNPYKVWLSPPYRAETFSTLYPPCIGVIILIELFQIIVALVDLMAWLTTATFVSVLEPTRERASDPCLRISASRYDEGLLSFVDSWLNIAPIEMTQLLLCLLKLKL